MSAIVVNRIRLTVPAEEVIPDVEREIAPFIRTLPGFEHFSVARIGDREVVVVIAWASCRRRPNTEHFSPVET